jgi:large subunit ribosomal protein L22
VEARAIARYVRISPRTENNHGMNRDNLYVAKAVADEGPTMKRIFPRARGRADIMRKRTSHITIVVKERE